ncbi:GHKL domain-containing protein [Pseudoflavonifractor sp. 60]|nr:GHKL domain-containing protein [Pseudoflavonifractor sp. 60]
MQLSLSIRGRNICISVSNPCAGVDTAQLSRYFDRFYRADSSRARSTGGYGIGLSTVKAIVARHKGRISNRYADGLITFTAAIPQMS